MALPLKAARLRRGCFLFLTTGRASLLQEKRDKSGPSGAKKRRDGSGGGHKKKPRAL